MGIDAAIVKDIIGIPFLKLKDGLPDPFRILDFNPDFLGSYKVKGKLIGLVSIILESIVSKANAIIHPGGKVKEVPSLLIIAQVSLVNRRQEEAIGILLPIIEGVFVVGALSPDLPSIGVFDLYLLNSPSESIGIERLACDNLKPLLGKRAIAQDNLSNLSGGLRE